MIKLPEDFKVYLVIYTTEYDDSYILETIASADIQILKKKVEGKKEFLFETEFDYEQEDETAGLQEHLQLRKIRKLDKKIGENLKLLYGYRCQICGRLIGEEFDSHVVEAPHIILLYSASQTRVTAGSPLWDAELLYGIKRI